MLRRLLRKPVTWITAAALAAGVSFGLYWFQPWRLVTDKEVREDLPVAVAPAPSGSPGADAPAPTPAATLVANGDFITHEHDTSGAAQLITRPDGRHQLILRDLVTSDGPDLRVWLTDQPVRAGQAGWRVFDDGEWVELGRLKGNRGDQVYDVPADVDIDAYRSISIWCRRFAVSFGAAELRPA